MHSHFVSFRFVVSLKRGKALRLTTQKCNQTKDLLGSLGLLVPQSFSILGREKRGNQEDTCHTAIKWLMKYILGVTSSPKSAAVSEKARNVID